MIGKIEKGICSGKDGRYPSCGNTDVYIVNKSTQECYMCNEARKRAIKQQKPPKNNNHVVLKAKELAQTIKERKEYYDWAIQENIKKNLGVCRCDECGEPINNPTGKNVSHLVSGGANQTLYLHPLNHFIFGNQLKFDKCKCEQLFSDEGKRESMKIYPEFKRRWELLNHHYYTKNKKINPNHNSQGLSCI